MDNGVWLRNWSLGLAAAALLLTSGLFLAGCTPPEAPEPTGQPPGAGEPPTDDSPFDDSESFVPPEELEIVDVYLKEELDRSPQEQADLAQTIPIDPRLLHLDKAVDMVQQKLQFCLIGNLIRPIQYLGYILDL